MPYTGSCAQLQLQARCHKSDSKSADRKVMGVRPPLPAPCLSLFKISNIQNRPNHCAQKCAHSVPVFPSPAPNSLPFLQRSGGSAVYCPAHGTHTHRRQRSRHSSGKGPGMPMPDRHPRGGASIAIADGGQHISEDKPVSVYRYRSFPSISSIALAAPVRRRADAPKQFAPPSTALQLSWRQFPASAGERASTPRT